MTDADRMKLVFRLGKIGFTLAVHELIEITEVPLAVVDRTDAEPGRNLLGQFLFRGRTLPLYDLGGWLGLKTEAGGAGVPVVLVLEGRESPWGIVVDRVEGVYPRHEFVTCSMPPLLVLGNDRFYEQLDIRSGEPLVRLDPARVEGLRETA